MKTKLYLVALVLLTILFASCDSLWQVGESTDVSMSINLHDIAGGSLFLGDDDDGFDVEINDGSSDRYSVTVTLHNEDGSIIESQSEELRTESSTADILFTFEQVPVNVEAYATVKIYGFEGPANPKLIFSAQSKTAKIKIGKNNIVARPNMLFYDGSVLAYVKGSSDGIDTSTSIEMLDKAFEAFGGKNNLAPSATVVMGSGENISISTAISRDYDGMRILRGETTLRLVSIASSASSVNLSNLVLDGGDPEEETNTLLEVYSNITVTLNNVVFKNNHAGSGFGGAINNNGRLTMNNCIVTNNKSGGDGGGIYNTASGIIVMNNCVVSRNSSARGGGIYNAGILTLSGCTITENNAGEGDDVKGSFTDNGGNNITNHQP